MFSRMGKYSRAQRGIGLLTCTREKRAEACAARDLYAESASFARHLAFAETKYDRVYVVSARHGLVGLNQVLRPYNCFLGSFSQEERQAWAAFVAACLSHEGMRAGDRLFLHTDILYRDYLTSALQPYDVSVQWVDFVTLPGPVVK